MLRGGDIQTLYRYKISKTSRHKGFTLLETIVAIAILAILGTAVISSFMMSFKAMRSARSKVNAVTLANQKMEELRNLKYDNPVLNPPGPPDGPPVTIDNETFTVHTTVSFIHDTYDNPGGDPSPDDYKIVKVTVSQGSTIKAEITSNYSP